MNQKLSGLWFGLVAPAALVLVSVWPLAAQDAVFRGTVKSERGEPLAGAYVHIAELNMAAPTSAEGRYVLAVPGARVRGQQFALRVRAIGYKPGSQAINLVPGEQTVDFTLATDVFMLEQVVVTGQLGETEAIKSTFAVTRVDESQMPVAGVNPLQQLQGRVPGAQIKSTSGRPGSPQAVIIRGPKALDARGRSQEPLYIVDGVPIVGSLPDINPSDIESVEIVRGAAGGSVYGALSSTGVVQIRTKRGLGAIDDVQFRARSEAGFQDIERDFGLARNHALLMDETNRYFCQSVPGVPLCARVFDWRAEAARINNVPGEVAPTPAGFPVDPGASTAASALRSQFQSKRWPGPTYNAVDQAVDPNPFYMNSVDMQGRFGSTALFASASNVHDGGAIRFLEGYERNSVRLNVDQRFGSAWSVGVTSSYSRSTGDGLNQERGGAAFFTLTRVPAIVDILQRDTLGRLYIRPNLQNSGSQNENPLQSLENTQRQDVTNRFFGGATVRFTPVDWLDFQADFGYDGRRRRYAQFQDKGFRETNVQFIANTLGQVIRGAETEEAWNASLGATLQRRHLGGDLVSRTSLRYSYRQEDYDSAAAQGTTLAVQGVSTLNNTSPTTRLTESVEESERLIGLSGGVSLEYKDRYFLDAAIRRDGSSLFGVDNRWQTFGRASAGWRVSREPWWPVAGINEFKLRTAYGTSGGRPRFNAQYETFTIQTGGIVAPVQLGNRNLGPERNTELEVGAEIGLFDRVLLSATYARSRTKDQILAAPLEAGSGFITQWVNAGTLLNVTHELALTVPVIERPDLTWSLGLTYDNTKSWIQELDIPPYSAGNTLQGTGSIFRFQEGERFGTFYGRKFVRDCRELPAPFNSSANCGGSQTAFQFNDEGYLVWVGRNNSWREGITRNLWQEQLPGTNAPWGVGLNWGMPITVRKPECAATPRPDCSAEQLPLGNALPDFRFAITQNLTWKRLTVYALLDASIGHKVWNQGRHWAHLDFLAKEIDQEGKSVETAKPIGYYWREAPAGGLGGFYDILAPNSHFVESASFAKLRELLVSYHVGPVGGVGDWEVSLAGRNLFTITGYKGFDPEVGISGGDAGSAAISAIDSFTFPVPRGITIGLSTNF